MTEIAIALTTACISSLLTWLIAYAFYRLRLSEQMDKLRRDINQEVEESVRRGVLKAGEELLPHFRKEVTQGFMDAMPGSDVARTISKTSAGIVGNSIDSLFGSKKRNRAPNT